MGPHIKGFEYAEVQNVYGVRMYITLDTAGWRGVGGLAIAPFQHRYIHKCNERRPCRLPLDVYTTAARNVSCAVCYASCVDMHHTNDTGWMIPLAWTVLPTRFGDQ